MVHLGKSKLRGPYFLHGVHISPYVLLAGVQEGCLGSKNLAGTYELWSLCILYHCSSNKVLRTLLPLRTQAPLLSTHLGLQNSRQGGNSALV